MNSRLTLAAGLCATLVTSAQAAVKINENLSLDGYAIGSAVMTEGTPVKNESFGNGSNAFDSVYVALNGTYGDFSGKISLYAVNSGPNGITSDAGVLDAYLTYTVGALSLTAGKYLGWLGFESFHSPSNAFISFSQAAYASPFSTGVKADYAGDGFSTGISIRDSQAGPGGSFFEGDGEISEDIGLEAYFLYSGIDKLTVFAGAGYEDVDDAAIDDSIMTLDFWASYQLTEKFSLAAELAYLEKTVNYSWLTQGTYAVTEDLSISARLTGRDTDAGDAFGYGIASTYTITENFSVKGEVTKTEFNAPGTGDAFQYAIQGLFRF